MTVEPTRVIPREGTPAPADDRAQLATARGDHSRTLPRVSTHPQYEPSPVPSDADLGPEELPFTAWGQFNEGAIDLRVFDQGIWWVDVQQRPHRLTEMSPQYLTNVITHLHEHAEHFHHGQCRRRLTEIICDALTGRPNVDLIAEAAGAPALSDLTPTTWLHSTPLMRALLTELARRPT